MKDEDKQNIIQTLQTLIVAISDGSIISNAKDYAEMVEGMFKD